MRQSGPDETLPFEPDDEWWEEENQITIEDLEDKEDEPTS